MSENVKFRSVIKFLLLRNTSSQDIISQLNEAYGDNCPCKATIYNWIREFRSGRTSVFDADRPGRPIEISSHTKEKLQEIVQSERRITTRELIVRLNVSKGTLHDMLHDLGLRKLCSRFVPRFLTAEMQQMRRQCAKKNLEIFDELGCAFIYNIVTKDETPLSLYLSLS